MEVTIMSSVAQEGFVLSESEKKFIENLSRKKKKIIPLEELMIEFADIKNLEYIVDRLSFLDFVKLTFDSQGRTAIVLKNRMSAPFFLKGLDQVPCMNCPKTSQCSIMNPVNPVDCEELNMWLDYMSKKYKRENELA